MDLFGPAANVHGPAGSLAERGKLSLDDPMTRFFPGFIRTADRGTTPKPGLC